MFEGTCWTYRISRSPWKIDGSVTCKYYVASRRIVKIVTSLWILWWTASQITQDRRRCLCCFITG